MSNTLTTLCLILLPLMFIFSWGLEQKTDAARVVVPHKHNAGTYQKVNATVYKSIGWRIKRYRGSRRMPTHGCCHIHLHPPPYQDVFGGLCLTRTCCSNILNSSSSSSHSRQHTQSANHIKNIALISNILPYSTVLSFNRFRVVKRCDNEHKE